MENLKIGFKDLRFLFIGDTPLQTYGSGGIVNAKSLNPK